MNEITELKRQELMDVYGGKVPWGRLKDWGQKAWNAITATDAYLSFKEGWDSVECGCSE